MMLLQNRRRITPVSPPYPSGLGLRTTGATGQIVPVQSLADQRLNHRLPTDVQVLRGRVQFFQHAGGERAQTLRQIPSNRFPQNCFSEGESIALSTGGHMRRAVVATFLLVLVSLTQAQAPSISGTWKLDRDLTTADMRWDKTSTLVLSQSDDELRFEYFDPDGRLFGTDTFTTDDLEHPRYKTRIERAWSRARWKQGKLVITSRVNLDLQGYQSYNAYESWELSPDGKTLINRLSDGKTLVFEKQTPSQPASPQE